MFNVFYRILGMGLLLMTVIGCGGGGDASDGSGDGYTFTFSNGTEGWSGGFSDYSKNIEGSLSLRFAHTTLPAPLDRSNGAVMLSGVNRSDDLFMYIKRRIDGLLPDTAYALHYTVTFASNAPDNAVGIGGAPGEGVTLKAGAVAHEPLSVIDASGYCRINIDKGNQIAGGKDMVVIGNFANGTDRHEYALKTVGNTLPFVAETDETGTLWLIVGTDSGFEGSTTIYYDRIDVRIEKVSE